MKLLSRARAPLARASLALGLGLTLYACDDEGVSTIAALSEQKDVFEQTGRPRVDVLWVIDNSISMADKQDRIGREAGRFLQRLIDNDIDYHMGVITTDTAEGGKLRRYGGSAIEGCDGCRFVRSEVGCPNPSVDLSGLDGAGAEQRLAAECPALLVFGDLVRVGTDGRLLEEAFEHTAMAFGLDEVDPLTGAPIGDAPRTNAGFLRRDADLFIIFASDEDEGFRSHGPPVHYYARLFAQLKAGTGRRVAVASIVGWFGPPAAQDLCDVLSTRFDADPTNDDPRLVDYDEIGQRNYCASADGSIAEPGRRYIELSCRTGGVVASICQQSYSASLGHLGESVVKLSRAFQLSRATELDRGPDCVLFTEDDGTVDCDGDGSADGEADSVICVTAQGAADDEPRHVARGPDGWTWDDETASVVFAGSFVPKAHTPVTIHYKLAQVSGRCGASGDESR